MTVARVLLLGALVLTVGIDLVGAACEQRLLQRQIRQLEGELRLAQSECAQARSAFHGSLVALRFKADDAAPLEDVQLDSPTE
ncbi:MAG: hypothetical protein AAF581_12805 [Planctomycetota bacterium]